MNLRVEHLCLQVLQHNTKWYRPVRAPAIPPHHNNCSETVHETDLACEQALETV